jgi:hypothetical protein
MERTATVDSAAAPALPWRSRAVAIADAVPVWLWLGGLVVVSAIVRFALALAYPAPWIFPDSLIYGDLAKSFAETGHFALRGVPGRAGFGVVYPILLSPAYAIFDNIPAAFTAIKAINAVLMSLAAVPTYFLARRLVGKWLALTAAMLALAVPGFNYIGTVMTENAFYPVFLVWCWATVRAIELPTIRRQIAVILALALAYFTRPQGLVLVPALLTALALVTVLDAWSSGERPFLRSLGRSARRYLVIWLGLGGAGGAYFLFNTVGRGQGWQEALFGTSYSTLGFVHYSVSDVGRWFLYHLGELAFSLALLPFAALLLVILVGLDPRERSRELRIFAALAVASFFWITLAVAAFAASPFGFRMDERSMFYLDPLCLIALVAVVGRGLIWSRRTTAAVAALVAVGLVAAVPYASFIGATAANDAFALLNLMSILDRRIVSLPQLQAAVVAGATVAAVLFILVPRRFALLLPAFTLFAFAFANGPVHTRTSLAAKDSRNGGVQAHRDWIDRAVGTKPTVTALWSGRAAYVTLWDNEFFNRSLHNVYNFLGPPDGLPQNTVVLQPTGAVTLFSQPTHAQYVLADPTLILAGTPVARDKGLGMTLYRVDGPIAVRGKLEGVYPDLWSGPGATYTEYNCTGGTVLVRLTSDPNSHPFPQTITATVGNKQYKKVLRPRQFYAPFSVPVTPVDHVCHVTYSVSPTAIPAQTIQNGDTRTLGIRFVRVVYRPPHGPPVVNR